MDVSLDAGLSGEICARKPLHTRRVICAAYIRDDGLLEIEGSLLDVKPFDFHLGEDTVPAGEPIHGMHLRIALDWQLVIQEAVARFDHTPFEVCRKIREAYRKLVGIQIKSGFRSEVKALLGGERGCTHMTELLGSMATTAVQAQVSAAEEGSEVLKYPVGGCYAFRKGGELVKSRFPEFYAPEEESVS